MAAITSLILGGAALVGAGASAYGSMQSARAAKDQAAAQQQMIDAQQRQEALRMKAMELDNRRKQTEALRQQQRARALSLATATNQGAGQGSGLFGAYGQTQGMVGNNLLGLNQALQFGQQNFAINGDISSARMGMASAQSQAMQGQALSSLGGTILSNLGTINNIGKEFQGFGSSSGSNSWYNSPSSLYASNNAWSVRA